MEPIPLQREIIYGPVRSRRLGASLGLNISPTDYKLCSFDCVYCQYGWTAAHTFDTADKLGDFPSPDDFRQALDNTLRNSEKIDNITFSGNGESTVHPQFEQLVDIVEQLKEKYFSKANMGILSNASTIHVQKVRHALTKLDFKIMKLDTGNLMTFRKINRPCREVDYQTILDGLKSMEKVTLQTMFVEGLIQNTGDPELNEWMERVGDIKPVSVQIYSLHRPPAESSLKEVPKEKLEEIAMQTEKTTGVPIEVIAAKHPYRRRPALS